MSTHIHFTIFVCGFDSDQVARAHAKAVEIFDGPKSLDLDFQRLVSEIIPSMVNGYSSFVIAPDGSGLGWPTAEEASRRRRRFIAWLESNKRTLSSLDWFTVRHGEADYKVINRDHDNAASDMIG